MTDTDTPEKIKEAAEAHAHRLADMRARHLAAHKSIERHRHIIDRRLPSNAERRARWEAEKKRPKDEGTQ